MRPGTNIPIDPPVDPFKEMILKASYGEEKNTEPWEFYVGRHYVPQGLDYGVTLMRKGEKARLTIPDPMGYNKNDVEYRKTYEQIGMFMDVTILEVRPPVKSFTAGISDDEEDEFLRSLDL